LKIGLRAALGAGAAAAVLAMSSAHAFDLTDTAGRRHRLAEEKGHYVVLNFWATWCVPCIEEIPEIARFAREHPQVRVIGVATDVADEAKTKQFAAKHGLDYPLVLSDDKVEKSLGVVRALPTTRVYDPKGKLVYDKPGRVDHATLEKLVAGG
jgi:thiol-disulfide isomerase/thioredoxin